MATLKRTAENIKDPLFRFFEREVNSGSRLLTTVRNDLDDIISVCEARKKQTNYLRSVISDLTKGGPELIKTCNLIFKPCTFFQNSSVLVAILPCVYSPQRLTPHPPHTHTHTHTCRDNPRQLEEVHGSC